MSEAESPRPPSNSVLLVMAAGLSKRFGPTDKLHAPLRGQPVYMHCLENLSPVDFTRRVVVLPPHDPVMQSRFERAGYETVDNPAAEQGLGSSIRLGLNHLSDQPYHHVCIALADMPFVGADHITRLLQNPDHVCVSTHKTVSLPPLVFPNRAVQSLLRVPQQDFNTARKTLVGTPDRKEFPLSKQAAIDIDTPNDLRAYQ